MNRLALFVILLAFTISVNAQKGVSISIYFQSDGHIASMAEVDRLHTFLKDKECESCFLEISAHTDTDGSDHYNQVLSERRLKNLKSLIVDKFSCFEVRTESADGEKRSLNGNKDEDEKALNRRVEINLVCEEKEEIKEEEEGKTQNVWGDYSTNSDDYYVDCATTKWASLEADDGIKVIVDPGTYSNDSKQARLTFQKCTSKEEAFKLGFTTMTDNDILESAGMFRMTATVDGEEVEPIKQDGIHVYVPMSQSETEGFGRYAAKKEGQYTLWDPMVTDLKNDGNHSFYFPKQELDKLYGENGNIAANCNLFWCKVKSFFSKKYRMRRMAFYSEQVKNNWDAMAMYQLFKKDLKKEFSNEDKFAAFLTNNGKDAVLNLLQDKIKGFDNVSYYVMDLPTSNWTNLDCVLRAPKKTRTNVVINHLYDENSDVRLFFKNKFTILKANSGEKGKVVFKKVPIGEVVTVVVVKKVKNIIYMAKKSFTAGKENRPSLKFHKVNSPSLNAISD